ncbi:hypothetical protein ACQR1I_19840 [Bradyrhizobium sp. HKCCYLS2038]|uniref:hypothetical protein n=1 Tax=Bradyrhizobium sp. HKCCYLS2038 TaxID=3420764 RepID=UPI003EC0E640
MLMLNYPHLRPSLEPARLRREEIWQIGEIARQQIGGRMSRPKIELSRIVARSNRFTVNGLSYEAHWEIGRSVTDDAGHPVMGAIEYDESWPSAAMISVNGELIGDREDLARSTVVHELGHAVFDAPSWIRRGQSRPPEAGALPMRHFQQSVPGEGASDGGIDWSEWRANEFMGAFLVPCSLLHVRLHKRAAALRVPLMEVPQSDGLPVVNGYKAGFDAIETLAFEMAELFGVSATFMLVRFQKYGLVTSI